MIYYTIILSLITFVIWGIDKYRAQADRWRIPEKTLLALTVFGGSYGALLGMQVFRHKTRKANFRVIVIGACVIHTLLLAGVG